MTVTGTLRGIWARWRAIAQVIGDLRPAEVDLLVGDASKAKRELGCSVDDLVRALDVLLAEGRGSVRCVRGLERARRWSWDQAARQLLNVYREAA